MRKIAALAFFLIFGQNYSLDVLACARFTASILDNLLPSDADQRSYEALASSSREDTELVELVSASSSLPNFFWHQDVSFFQSSPSYFIYGCSCNVCKCSDCDQCKRCCNCNLPKLTITKKTEEIKIPYPNATWLVPVVKDDSELQKAVTKDLRDDFVNSSWLNGKRCQVAVVSYNRPPTNQWSVFCFDKDAPKKKKALLFDVRTRKTFRLPLEKTQEIHSILYDFFGSESCLIL